MLETDVQVPPETPEKPESRNWTWLIVALVVVLALVIGGAVGWWLGSSDDDAADVDDPQLATATELVDTWHQGTNERDHELAASVFTEDAVFVGAWDSPFETRAAIEDRARISADLLTGQDRVSELTLLEDDVYSYVNQWDAPDGHRHLVMVFLDGELISQLEWIYPYGYEAADRQVD